MSRIVDFIYLFGFCYLSFRYPFQINSSTTSAIYSDTPLILSIAKYIIFYFVFFYAIFLFMVRNSSSFRLKTNVWLLFFSLIYGLVISLIEISIFKETYLAEVLIFSPAIMLHYFFRDNRNIYCKNLSYIKLFSVLYVFVNFIQILLFFVVGRLPALAWEGSYSIRFGSLIDDPNGFAILCGLFFFCFHSRKTTVPLWWAALLGICLLSTQSLTGIACVIIGVSSVLLFRVIFLKEKSSLRMLGIIYSSICIISLLIFNYFGNLISELWVLKKGSIEDHGSAMDIFSTLGFSDFAFLRGSGQAGEIGYLNVFLNSGVVFFLLYLCAMIFILLRVFSLLVHFFKKKDSGELITLYSCIACYMLCFVVGNFNLPLTNVFPVNFFYWYFFGMVLFFVWRKNSEFI